MKKMTSVIAAVCALTLVAGACSDNASTQSVTVISPASGTSIGGNVASIALGSTGVQIVKADGDSSGKTGHFHIFIDRDPVAAGQTIPKEAGIVHSTDNPVVLTGLTIGRHRLVVVFGDGDHARIGTAQAEMTVDVTGPSIHATTPPTVAAGTSVRIHIAVDGLLRATNGEGEAAVFLTNDISEDLRQTLKDALAQIPDVESITYQSKEQAYERFKLLFANQPEILKNTDPSALPESFRVKLTDLTQFEAFKDRAQGLPGVDTIRNDAGRLGHLHLLVDREPTAAGQSIPVETGIIHTTETSVEIPGLAVGEHTIWVVAGDANHVPLDPRVMDKVVVTVQ